jgi:hypothetical protein
MRAAVYHHPTLAADALAAVVVEFHWSFSLPHQPVIQRIQHLQERHVGVYLR